MNESIDLYKPPKWCSYVFFPVWVRVDGGAGAAFRDAEPDDGSIRVFSRYREKDPYR